MLNTGFAPWPSFAADELAAVEAVLRSGQVNYWTGDEGRAFEREFAAWCGSPYAVALANGTVAIDLALKLLHIGPGDEVIVTPRTFLASATCIVNAGARPVFADVDRDSQNITAETIAPTLSKRTRAIECVHLAGWPCEMDGILALAKDRGLAVIEDCAQAVGAKYRGRSVGTFGEAAAWSFCQDKIMTTGGEGGMLSTSERALWSAAWSYKDHGKSWEAVYEREHPIGFKWLHEVFGIANSRFLVTATVTTPDGASGERCFAVEPAPIPGTAIACTAKLNSLLIRSRPAGGAPSVREPCAVRDAITTSAPASKRAIMPSRPSTGSDRSASINTSRSPRASLKPRRTE